MKTLALAKLKAYQFLTSKFGGSVEDWMANKKREYGSSNAFYASYEYAVNYPFVLLWHKIRNNELKNSADKALKESGLKYGDRVFYDYVSPYGIVVSYSGFLQMRKGIPYVKLDAGQKTMKGAKSVRWHKGWKKIKE